MILMNTENIMGIINFEKNCENNLEKNCEESFEKIHRKEYIKTVKGKKNNPLENYLEINYVIFKFNFKKSF
jgi:hypothetical protein